MMLTAQVEDLNEASLEELKPLLPTHYDELSEHKAAGIPLDPQFGLYLARAAAGQVMYVTLREKGRLTGYLVSFVVPGMHYQGCLTATTDIFFVTPDLRGLSGGKLLFEAWKKECARRGVQLMQIGIKTRHAKYATPLIEGAGFKATELMFWQFLDKD
jgi:GNAT superfamily N-acetyltransferase